MALSTNPRHAAKRFSVACRVPRKGSKVVFWISVAVAFFVFSFAYYYLTKGKIAINAYPDELRYVQYAVSLAEGHGISLHGVPTNYVHVLYSFVLAPIIYLFSDSVTQIKLIALLNSVMMASACFPVALVARERIESPLIAFVPVLLSLLLPETLYSMTLMSENLYFPLCAWAIYFLHSSLMAPRLRNGIIAGALCGLLVLTKICGLSFPVGFLLLLFVRWLRGAKRDTKSRVVLVVCFCLAFCAVYGIFYVPISMSAQMEGGYNNQISTIMELCSQGGGCLLFFFYGLLHNIAFVTIGFMVFPLVVPVIFRKDLDEGARSLLALCLAIALTLVVIVSVTITLPEDIGYGFSALRVHFRYFFPLAPFLIICLFCVLEKKPAVNRTHIVAFVATTFVLSLLVSCMGGVRYASHVDNMSLFVWSLAENALGTTSAEMRACIIGASVFIPSIAVLLALRRRNRSAMVVVVCVLAMALCCNGACYAQWYRANFLQNPALMEQIESVIDVLDKEGAATTTYSVQPNIYAVGGGSVPIHYMDTFLRHIDSYKDVPDRFSKDTNPTPDLTDSVFDSSGIYVFDSTYYNVNLSLEKYNVLYASDSYLVLKVE